MVFVCVVAILDHDLFPVCGSVTGVQVDVRRTEIGSVVGQAAVNAGDVLPDHPAGAFAISKAEKFEGQVATVVAQAASEAGDAEGLAGGSANKKVNCPIIICSDGGEVAMERDLRVMVGEDSAREGLDLAERGGFPAQRVPGDGCGFDAGADREIAKRWHVRVFLKLGGRPHAALGAS
jgi:hypothetical protein